MPRNPAAGLEDVLYGRAHAAPVPAVTLRAVIGAARGDFRDARYDRVPMALPKIIAAAQATSQDAGPGQRAEASALLTDAYILAADFAVKINDDPLLIVDARRAVAVAMRRA